VRINYKIIRTCIQKGKFQIFEEFFFSNDKKSTMNTLCILSIFDKILEKIIENWVF
jgi:hypothetical protein